MKIAVVGGTGPQGKGLAYRFSRGGHSVIVGSRDARRAEATAADLTALTGGSGSVSGTTNASAAAAAEVVLLAVPYDGHADLVASLDLAGKTVISCVNPLGFDKRGAYGLSVPDGSAAEEAARLAPDADVVGAFHNLSAVNLWWHADLLVDEDVLVCGDSKSAKATVMELAGVVTGHPGIDVGPLRLARHLEALTAVLISVNRRYGTHSGIHITGINR
jgi:NADPH-dependent F420 reductase